MNKYKSADFMATIFLASGELFILMGKWYGVFLFVYGLFGYYLMWKWSKEDGDKS